MAARGIVRQLGLPEECFEISGVNLGAASALGVGVRISGLSADLSTFIAILSAALQISTSSDFVATGHIASSQGDITAVKGILAKLEAAINDSSIKRFIYPDLRDDASLKALSPSQRDRSITAIMAARDAIHTTAVRGIDELVSEVFAEEDIVLASLKEGFFDVSGPRGDGSDPVTNAISYLANDNERRFWSVLQRYFSAGMCDEGKELLDAFAHFYIRRRRYPTAFGAKLFQLLCSLPPAVRRLNIKFPILDRAVCAGVGKLAQSNDYDDVPSLLDAALGRHIIPKNEPCRLNDLSGKGTPDTDCMAFDAIASLINEQTLAREISIPIDSARGSYTLASSTVETYGEFIGTLESFYIHMKLYIGDSPAGMSDTPKARSEAIAILERTFYDKGQDKAAFARARDGTGGGMKFILDAVTEQYKTEEHAKYILRVFKDAMSEMEWDEQVQFMRGAMKRLGPFLPVDLRDEPADRFTGNCEAVVRAYVQSVDRMGQLLRTM